MDLEKPVRIELASYLESGFDVYEEVWLRHALFRERRLRCDLLAIPHDPDMADIILAFEVKYIEDKWDSAFFCKAVNQASDYIYATIEPNLPEHAGKRVLAAFVFPWAGCRNSGGDNLLRGIARMAGYHRVGIGVRPGDGWRKNFMLECNADIWCGPNRWFVQARHILAGKRQIGSTKFSILEELEKLST